MSTRSIPFRTLHFAAFCALAITGSALVLSGCSASGDTTVAKIGEYSLSLAEYEKQFVRNNGGVAAAQRSTEQERKDFLGLLVKYRLKVLEARSQGYDKDAEIQKELAEYRNSLAIPYLTERALIDPKIQVLYERRKQDMRAAHILVRIKPDTTGFIDSVKAMTEAKRILALAQKGENFDSLAVHYSEDPGTASKGGDLMYFTAGMTTPAFDEAVYSMQPGEVYKEPIKTMFGYHIVKLIDRKPSRGEVQCSHILVRFPKENPEDTLASYRKIKSILDTLNKGGDFAQLARINSEDPMSGENGGDLGWMGRRKFVPEFEMVAFDMRVGETSGIVRTPFGYHIIRVMGERPGKAFEESRQELKETYRRYGYEEENRAFVNSILKKYAMTVDDQTVAAIADVVDTTATTAVPGWYSKIPDAVKSRSFVTLTGKSVAVDDAIKTIERNKDLQGKPLNRASLRELGALIGEKEAMQLETADLETRYPEFAELMQEYREGVLLFRAEQDAVWNKVTVKEEGLRKFWEEHKSEYVWPDRVSFNEIFVANDSIAKVLRDSVNAGADFLQLAARHTTRPGYREKNGDWGLQPESTNELSKAAMLSQPGWVEGPIKFQTGYALIKVGTKEKAREKTFEEAQSEVSSKYQEYESKRLETEWIESLKQKFGVQLNEGALTSAFKSLGGNS